MKSKLFATCLVIAAVYTRVSPAGRSPPAIVAQASPLASQLSQVIRATQQGSLSDAAYTQKLRDALLAALENRPARDADDVLAQIDPA